VIPIPLINDLLSLMDKNQINYNLVDYADSFNIINTNYIFLNSSPQVSVTDNSKILVGDYIYSFGDDISHAVKVISINNNMINLENIYTGNIRSGNKFLKLSTFEEIIINNSIYEELEEYKLQLELIYNYITHFQSPLESLEPFCSCSCQ
jgi:hypothetical protein